MISIPQRGGIVRTLILVIAFAAVLAQPAVARPVPTETLKLTALGSDSCVFTGLTMPPQTPATAVFRCRDIPSFRTFGPIVIKTTSQCWTADCHGIAFGPPHIMDIREILQGLGTIEEKFRNLETYFATHKTWSLEGQRPYTF